jgi:SAM-dependent methyltransferase
MEHARAIILSSDPDGRKWREETETTVDLLIGAFERAGRPIGLDSVMLDYGCGVGRVAKRLIERTGCTVIGTDIVLKMLEYAGQYVGSPNFIACPQSALEKLTATGLRVDGAFSIWVLQHCMDPEEDVRRIISLLKPDPGLLFVLNKTDRYLPVVPEGRWAKWADDEVNVVDVLGKFFRIEADCGSRDDDFVALLSHVGRGT